MDNYLRTVKVHENRISQIEFHWGLEKRPLLHALASLPHNQAVMWADRFSNLESLSAEWALCICFEKAYRLKPPERAVWGRALLCEVQRIIWASNYFARLFRVAEDGFREEIFWTILDSLLSVQETITGGRVLPQPFSVGSLRRDISLGDIDKIKTTGVAVYDKVNLALDGLEDDFFFVGWMERGLKINRGLLEEKGITGPLIHACGLGTDMRTTSPYGPYRQLIVDTYKPASDVMAQGRPMDRARAVKFQLFQSLELVKEILLKMPTGIFQHRVPDGYELPEGETWDSAVEAPSGALRCKLKRGEVRFSSTTTRLKSELDHLFVDMPIDDFEISLMSLGIDFMQGGCDETSA